MRLARLVDAPPPLAQRPAKSAEAFRTISEVAQDLDVPQHVLRFWESKFPQVKPLKRAGGRRYYRPDDVALLRRIRQCLYEQGYTIRGVQKLLRESGARGEGDAAAPAGDGGAAASTRPDEGLRDALAELRDELAHLRDRLRDAGG
jgi:DNA-binding transcriptional MerR regulator